jgi:hypothetical protein
LCISASSTGFVILQSSSMASRVLPGPLFNCDCVPCFLQSAAVLIETTRKLVWI